MAETVVYHGTFWEKAPSLEEVENSAFFDLDTGYSDSGVVYVTDSEDTATYFSKWKKSSEEDIQVILRGELLAENLLEKSVFELQQQSTIEIDGTDYEVTDREELLDAMRGKFAGFNIVGNYDGKGDDIALFSGSDFNATSAKILVDGQWTDWLDREQALQAYMKLCGFGEPAPSI